HLLIQTGGNIKLDSLQQITGGTYFNVQSPSLSLPPLQTAANTKFSLVTGTAVSVPSLLTLGGYKTALDLGINSTFDAPQLKAIDNIPISIDTGAKLKTLGLASFTNNRLTGLASDSWAYTPSRFTN